MKIMLQEKNSNFAKRIIIINHKLMQILVILSFPQDFYFQTKRFLKSFYSNSLYIYDDSSLYSDSQCLQMKASSFP
jgi:hypothetical protein